MKTIKVKVSCAAMAAYSEVIEIPVEDCDGDKDRAMELAESKMLESRDFRSWKFGKGEPVFDESEIVTDGNE